LLKYRREIISFCGFFDIQPHSSHLKYPPQYLGRKPNHNSLSLYIVNGVIYVLPTTKSAIKKEQAPKELLFFSVKHVKLVI
ncbi:MAG: hypothetical protein ACI4LQ_04610, partial [Anaerovoracaceae bacterium]